MALAIIAWPLHRRVRRYITTPKLAAGISTAVVMLVIVGAGLFVAYHLAREATSVSDGLATSELPTAIRGKLAAVPVLQSALTWMDRVGVDLEMEIRKVVGGYTQDASKLAQGSLAAIIQLLVTAFLLFHLLLDSSDFRQGLRDLLPLSRPESDQVMCRAAESVHASVYANFLTSFIDATGGGLMFWYLGISEPLLWGTVMFVLSLLPVVGAGLVWVPVALYLAVSGQWVSFLMLVTWGLLTFVIVDNFLYFRLIGTRMRMHQALALIGFLGGISIFGISGMILGPVILALTIAFLEVWKQRLAIGGGPPAPHSLAAPVNTDVAPAYSL